MDYIVRGKPINIACGIIHGIGLVFVQSAINNITEKKLNPNGNVRKAKCNPKGTVFHIIFPFVGQCADAPAAMQKRQAVSRRVAEARENRRFFIFLAQPLCVRVLQDQTYQRRA
jgi:hypothetical protein